MNESVTKLVNHELGCEHVKRGFKHAG
jgi:hypothetical protein